MLDKNRHVQRTSNVSSPEKKEKDALAADVRAVFVFTPRTYNRLRRSCSSDVNDKRDNVLQMIAAQASAREKVGAVIPSSTRDI